MIGLEIDTDCRVDTGGSTTGLFNLFILTVKSIHIGSRATKIGDNPGKARRHIANFFHFIEDRFFRTTLDNAPFMLGDWTEGTATKTAAHNIHRKTNHIVGGNFALTIGWMRYALIGLIKHPIQFLGLQGNWWRIDPYIIAPLVLHQWAGIAGIGFTVKNSIGMGIQNRIFGHLVKRRHANVSTIGISFNRLGIWNNR